MQHGEAVPAVLDRAELQRRLGGERSDRRAVPAREYIRADDDQRPLCGLQHLGEVALAGRELGQAVGPAPR